MRLLLELFYDGGWVMVLVAVFSFIAWLVAICSWLTARQISNNLNNEYVFLNTSMEKSNSLWNMAMNERSTLKIRESLRYLKVLAAVLPFLGLLGTVLGMLLTFNVIQNYGTGQPKLMADGIRQALLTTQAGLLAALPVLFFHHLISHHLKIIETKKQLILHEQQQSDKTNSI